VEYAKRRAEQQERYALIKEERKEKDKKRNEVCQQDSSKRQ
jgi:hypothetical protein